MGTSSSIILILVLISVVGKIADAVRKDQAKKGNPGSAAGRVPPAPGQPTIPYAQNPATQAASPVSKGFNNFREFMKELENEGREAQGAKPQPPKQNKPQTLKQQRPQSAPKQAAAASDSVEGSASQEGEDTLHISHRNPERQDSNQVLTPKAAAIFASRPELKRAIIMSEVLDKPVSLRRRGIR